MLSQASQGSHNMKHTKELGHMPPSNNDLLTADAMIQTGNDTLNMNDCSGMVVNTFSSVHYGNDVSVQVDISIPSGKNCHCKNIITNECASGPDTEGETNVATAKGFMGFTNISNEGQMKQLAGVSLSIFSMLVVFLQPTGKNANPTSFRKITKENRLLLTLMKLKLGLSFGTLSCIFLTTSKTVSTIFYQTLDTLLINTSNWIYWPSKEVVKSMLPTSFASYPNCRVIIDCTEIKCEMPPTVEERVLMYSQYKGGYTIKFLLGVTPNGFISFLSKTYGGRATDGFITVDSGFIDLLEENDLVMADKGFPQIKTEVGRKNSILVMPPFANKPQFEEHEVVETYKIASVRIHVERCIQRVKTYRVLDKITTEMFPHIDKIIRMCCVLANMKPPLIANQ